MTGSKELIKGIYQKWWPVEQYEKYFLEANTLRHAFHLDLVVSSLGKNIAICDIGGGWGVFSAGCALLGMKSILIDDFRDEGFFMPSDRRHEMPKVYGFETVNRDVIHDGIDFPPESVDVFTTFDSMEHWHGSPKKLFGQIMTSLRPGGLFIIGVPNCVNIRKRITVPIGIGKWSSMSDWYDKQEFRGHVREPDVDDLKYIARDLALADAKIIGRNWVGLGSQNIGIRFVSRIVDKPLRLFPSLCGDIYLIGTKELSRQTPL